MSDIDFEDFNRLTAEVKRVADALEHASADLTDAVYIDNDLIVAAIDRGFAAIERTVNKQLGYLVDEIARASLARRSP